MRDGFFADPVSEGELCDLCTGSFPGTAEEQTFCTTMSLRLNRTGQELLSGLLLLAQEHEEQEHEERSEFDLTSIALAEIARRTLEGYDLSLTERTPRFRDYATSFDPDAPPILLRSHGDQSTAPIQATQTNMDDVVSDEQWSRRRFCRRFAPYQTNKDLMDCCTGDLQWTENDRRLFGALNNLGTDLYNGVLRRLIATQFFVSLRDIPWRNDEELSLMALAEVCSREFDDPETSGIPESARPSMDHPRRSSDARRFPNNGTSRTNWPGGFILPTSRRYE